VGHAATLDGSLTVSNTLTAATNAYVLGSVGIGTVSPAYTLDVLGDINLTGTLRTNGSAWNPLAGYTETDPTFAASAAADITGTQVDNWNTAHGWGNHAAAGYLSSYTETDPTFAASAANGIAAGDITLWNAKLAGTGTEGYLPKFTAVGTVDNSALYSAASGNVGIGTATPAYKLDVAGSLNASGITIGGVPVASSTDTYWSTNAAADGSIQYSGGNVGVGTATPAASAALEVTATDKGMLVPRMTQAQRNAIGSPATGLLIYQTDNTPGFYFYDGAQWSSISAGAGAVTSVMASSPLTSSGGGTPTLSIQTANGSQAGALSAADWTAFSAKAGSGSNSSITRLSGLTTPLSAAQGGSGQSIYTTGDILYASGTNALSKLADVATGNALLSGGAGAAPSWGKVTLTNHVSGILPMANGGSGATNAAGARTALGAAASGTNSDITSLTGLTTDLSVAQGGTGASTLTGVVHGSGTSALTAGAVALASEVSGTLPVANGGSGAATLTGYVKGNGTSAMTAAATIPGSVITGNISGNAANVSGTVAATNGGSGQSSYTIGDVLYASGAAALSKLPAVATGNTLNSGGAGAAPAWGKVGLTTHVTGTLPVANGGSGASTLTANKILVGNGTSAVLAPTNLHWDNTNSRLGVGDTTPSYAVDVAGDVNVTGTVRVAGVSIVTPAGAILQFAGSTAPTGYLLCNGSSVSRATYTNLFIVIGTTYGSANATTFNLPNLLGRVPVGYDSSQTEFNALGEIGGAKTHTLATTELPAHSHSITDPGHNHSYDKTVTDSNGPFGDNSSEEKNSSTSTGSSTTGITIKNTGGNEAHNNLQPYIVLNYIIKY
jgi:microcystin-dependent protein